MIYPTTLYNFCKSCNDSEMIGNVLRALCGQDVELTIAEQMLYKMIANDNKWMDERLEVKKERTAARQREFRNRNKQGSGKSKVQNDAESCENEQLSQEASRFVTQDGVTNVCHNDECDITQDGVTNVCHNDECDITQDGVTNVCHNEKCLSHAETHITPPYLLTSSLTSLLPSSLPPRNINRSVTVTVPLSPKPKPKPNENGNENGTGEILVKGGFKEAQKRAKEAAKAIQDDESAFFSGEYSALSFILALTGDYGSINRWQQLVKLKGEDAICEELFAFYREIKSGEDVNNRGAALNKRLSSLPDKAGSQKI